MHTVLSIGLLVVIGALILGVLILVHELGHFLTAKAFGIRVLTFSIGFGKALFTKEHNGTEYRISMIPVGGFVHMAGEHPQDRPEGEAPQPGDFVSKPIWQRALVAVAGPLSNLVFAFVLLWCMFMLGEERPLYRDSTVIGAFADSSRAQAAGLASGDSILSVNGSQISSWDDIEKAFSKQDPSYAIRYARHSLISTAVISMPRVEGSAIPRDGMAGLLPSLPAVIGSVSGTSPAHAAGIMPGDRIVSINGEGVHSWFGVSQTIAKSRDHVSPLRIDLIRHDEPKTFELVPVFDQAQKKYIIGITVASPPSRHVRFTAFSAVPRAAEKTWEQTTMIFEVIGKLFSRQVSPRQLAGPIGIVQISGIVALDGLAAILNLVAFIGINLAVLNLLPLIITDGGMLLFLLLEAVRRKPLSLKAQLTINRIAIAFFLTLFIYVTINDISRAPQLFRMFNP